MTPATAQTSPAVDATLALQTTLAQAAVRPAAACAEQANLLRRMHQCIAKQRSLAAQAPMTPAMVLASAAAGATLALQTTTARAAVPPAVACVQKASSLRRTHQCIASLVCLGCS